MAFDAASFSVIAWNGRAAVPLLLLPPAVLVAPNPPKPPPLVFAAPNPPVVFVLVFVAPKPVLVVPLENGLLGVALALAPNPVLAVPVLLPPKRELPVAGAPKPVVAGFGCEPKRPNQC